MISNHCALQSSVSQHHQSSGSNNNNNYMNKQNESKTDVVSVQFENRFWLINTIGKNRNKQKQNKTKKLKLKCFQFDGKPFRKRWRYINNAKQITIKTMWRQKLRKHTHIHRDNEKREPFSRVPTVKWENIFLGVVHLKGAKCRSWLRTHIQIHTYVHMYSRTYLRITIRTHMFVCMCTDTHANVEGMNGTLQ